jgi:cob(I)alamin adenosyltransferase
MKQGKVQVYTGDGKGKTTAALGLMLRAVGAGLRVAVFQFMKGRESSETAALNKLEPLVSLVRCGGAQFVRGAPDEVDRNLARDGLDQVRAAFENGGYDLIILDEIFHLVHSGIISTVELNALLRERPADTELVLTGRDAPDEICKQSDLVTEMVARKHYFDEGVPARMGIEF